MHLITTSEELQQAISDIDNKSLSAAKKTAEKRSLLSTQIKIRKKVLGQNIHITFTHLRKQRPTSEILKELSQYIHEHPTECSELIQDPSVLVGKHISHKFEIAGSREIRWFGGTVVGYDMATKTHEIVYEGEEEHCFF